MLVQDPEDILSILSDGDCLVPHVEFEVSNVCNVSCIFCDAAHAIDKQEEKYEPYQLTVETLQAWLGGIKRVGLTILSGKHSEPLLNPDIAKIVYVLKSRNAQVRILSNGAAANRRLMERLMLAGLDELRISLHGATKETAESIMRNASFDRVIKNIRDLIELKRVLSINKPRVEIAFVGMKRNIKELEKVVKLAAGLDVDAVSLNTLMGENLSELDGESLVDHPELLREEYERALSAAKESKVRLEVNGAYKTILMSGEKLGSRSLSKGKTRYCLFPFQRIHLAKNGRLGLCCTDAGRYKSMGNSNDAPLAAVWNNDDYRGIRRSLLTGEGMPAYCRDCMRAPVVDPIVLQLDLALRQLRWYENQELRRFVVSNKAYYEMYAAEMRKLGFPVVRYEVKSTQTTAELIERIKKKDEQIKKKDEQIKKKDEQINSIKNSRSWRLTAPLRGLRQ